MREIILSLTNALNSFPTLIENPNTIFKLIDLFGQYTLVNDETVSQELKAHVEQLISLKELLQQHCQLQTQLTELTELQKNLHSLDMEQQKLIERHSQLEQDMEAAKTSLKTALDNLLPHLKGDSEKANNAILSIEAQVREVHEYSKQLSNELEQINTQEARFQVVVLKNKKTILIEELKQIGVFCPNDIHDHYESLMSVSKPKVEKLTQLDEKLSHLSDQFKNHISNTENQNKIDDLDKQHEQLKQDLEKIASVIKNDQLEDSIKQRLTAEFQDSKNKPDLITSYQNKITSFSTYVSPTAWINWSKNSNYAKEQQEYTNSVAFLNILTQQALLQSNQTTLINQKNQLTELLLTRPSQNPNENTLNRLIADTNALYNDYKVFITMAKPLSTATECYLLLCQDTPIINHKLHDSHLAMEKLARLHAIAKDISTLGNRFNLSTSSGDFNFNEVDYKPNDKEQQRLITAKVSVNAQELLCKEHRDKMADYELIKNRVATHLKTKNDLENKINLIQSQIIKQESSSSINARIAKLQEELVKSIDQIKALPPLPTKAVDSPKEVIASLPVQTYLDTVPSTPPHLEPFQSEQETSTHTKPEESTPEHNQLPTSQPNPAITSQPVIKIEPKDLNQFSPPSTPENLPRTRTLSHPLASDTNPLEQPSLRDEKDEELETETSKLIQQEPSLIEKYHQRNLNCIANLPRPIQEWYTQLYQAMNLSTEFPYKKSHLMRDIVFEFEQRNNLDVINAYIRLCPHPEKDLPILLQLKPELPICKGPFNGDELKGFPDPLKPLYEQYLKLKNDYCVEAELLLQAIHSLRFAKNAKGTSGIRVEHLPSFNEDPRYASLSRHRGFLRIWEAVEDFFRLIVGKITGQPEYQYSEKPCFFNTRSNRLIAEANLTIQNSPLPPSA